VIGAPWDSLLVHPAWYYRRDVVA